MKPRSLLFPLLAVAACNPYLNRGGEYNAGPVDPINFPPPYLGTGGSTKKSGGVFTPASASAGGVAITYYSFPFSAAQLKAMNPLVIGTKAAPTPNAFVFDPPLPARPRCLPPAGYVYDERRDGIHYDEQGAIFTALPTATYALGVAPTWSYIPLVAEVPVTSRGESCQGIKSASGLAASPLVSAPLMTDASHRPVLDSTNNPTGIPEGKYLAWALIDPGAEVDPLDRTTGLGPQKYGWFDHYLVAYIDGGYAPTTTTTTTTMPGSNGAPSQTVTTLTPQTIYVPVGNDALGNKAPMQAGALGSGFDVLDAKRGDAAYSPVCRVVTFQQRDWTKPATSSAAGDPNAIDLTTVKPAAAPLPPFIYCLQAQ